jgi:hypothetical protein
MQAFGSAPQYGRLIEARLQGVLRVAGRLEALAGGRDPAVQVPVGDASYRRQETS